MYSRKQNMLGITLAIAFLIIAELSPLFGVTLWSTKESFLGPGKFFGPGANTADQELFEVVIRNMAFFTEVDFVTPFFNNGPAEPNISGEKAFSGPVDGKLSNGSLINENVDLRVMTIAGARLLPAVIYDGPYRGQQLSVTFENGDVVMTMDLALDLGIGEKGVIKLAFYGTTGSVIVPDSLQTQSEGKGIDQAGSLPSGTVITGRIGDFNHDGWIDGTLVAVGNLPLNSPIYPGQPYAMYRNFETNIPIEGALFGDMSGFVKSPSENNDDKLGKRINTSGEPGKIVNSEPSNVQGTSMTSPQMPQVITSINYKEDLTWGHFKDLLKGPFLFYPICHSLKINNGSKKIESGMKIIW
jgi:hypothetical protein